ncbi:hypothetical protein [Blastococcus sp. TF02A-30]|uniref:hypothetical protein n=1 Tax=Blastococcus sp. TF02A-30 TaxID=2250580 RepID=UPI000DEBA4A2|nr:hypothetical protein [Blastococcus sp. TF02A-30]RBY86564.1 hypothetical protein DQ241_13730 [Blastococcus sp. TF02A-30]
MSKRTLTVSFLTAGLTAGILATAVGPAAAQGNPLPSGGNAFFLSGALNTTGVAQKVYAYGNVGDQVYYGDWFGTGEDVPMVRRANIYYVNDPDGKAIVFAYGNPDDEVLVGNWDGEGADLNGDGDATDTVFGVDEADAKTDSLAVRRGNHFFVKNDSFTTGKADSEFFYGDAGDTVLVGNWDGEFSASTPAVDHNGNGVMDKGTPAYAADVTPATDTGWDANGNGSYLDAGDRQPGTGVDNNGDGDFTDGASPAVPADVPAKPGKGDTIMIQRGNQFFVKNAITTGIADYTFYFGDRGDAVLVGDWATQPTPRVGSTAAKPPADADGADQLAIRRGNIYHLSTELEAARADKKNPVASRVFAFGEVNDAVFVAKLASPAVDAYGDDIADDAGTTGDDESVITGDGFGVRR